MELKNKTKNNSKKKKKKKKKKKTLEPSRVQRIDDVVCMNLAFYSSF